MYDVLLLTLAAPPAAAATESTMRMRCAFGGLPSLSSRPASAPMATMVPIVSKKSASISVKMSRQAETTPILLNEPSREKWPSRPKSGMSMSVEGSFGTLSRQPVGLTSLPATVLLPMWARASRTIAKIAFRRCRRGWRHGPS